jgi:hypothetical protein
MSFGWEADLPPGVPYSLTIFTSSRDFEYRDGNLGLTGLKLRLEAAGRSPAPANERFWDVSSTPPDPVPTTNGTAKCSGIMYTTLLSG